MAVFAELQPSKPLTIKVYEQFLKPVLFQFDPELVHNFFLGSGQVLGALPPARWLLRRGLVRDYPELQQSLLGQQFSSPIGLSAGFDKDGVLVKVLPTLGFGFAELGSVTQHAYAGNAGKRLTRIPELQSIAVNFGLKSKGVHSFAATVRRAGPAEIPLNISVARTNGTPKCTVEEAAADYVASLKVLTAEQVGELYTLNISCPNAATGELFTVAENLEVLLTAVDKLNLQQPLLVKMPLRPWAEFSPLLEVVARHRVQAVTISNLLKDRSGLPVKVADDIKGGLSGAVTRELSDELIRRTYLAYGQQLKIVGVGGIFSPEDAYRKLRLGASLLELITGMIYQGPTTIAYINAGLAELLKRDGFSNINEVIGIDAQELRD